MRLRIALALPLLLCLLPAPSRAVDGEWFHVDRFRFAPGRGDLVVVHDSRRDRMVVFGGFDSDDNQYYGDVWALQKGTNPYWTQLAANGAGPSARKNAAGIYDPVRDRLIIFGGWTGSQTVNDVWAIPLDGSGSWVQLFPDGTPPGPRLGHSAIYDPVNDQMVIFGGNDGSNFYRDTWALSLSGGPPVWSQLALSGQTPEWRYGHTAVYDSRRHRMLLFGGFGGPMFQGENIWFQDTWALPLDSSAPWESLAVSGPLPRARAFHIATYDSTSDRLLTTLGGVAPIYYPAGDTLWSLTFGPTPTWSFTKPTGSLQGNNPQHYSGAGDRSGNLVLVDGTRGGRMNSGALSYSGTVQWTDISPSVPYPDQNKYAGMVYDLVNDRLLWTVICGQYESWKLDLEPEPHWTKLTNSIASAPCGNGTLIAYDSLGSQVFDYYGGGSADPFVGAVTPGGVFWGKPTPSGTLPFGGTPTFNSTDNSLYVYNSGNNVFSRFNPSTAVWTQLFPSGPFPPTGSGETQVYDPLRNRILLFGGSGLGSTVYAIQFSPSLSWGPLTTSGSPKAFSGARAIYDALRDRLVVYGGSGENEVWELSLGGTPTWRKLVIQGLFPPLSSPFYVMAVPSRDRMMFGTMDSITQDIWYVNFLSGTQVGVPGSPRPSLAIQAAGTNPVSQAVALSFSIPTSDPANLTVMDVRGRVLWSRDVGPLGAGYHRVSVDASLSTGVYFAHLRQSGRSATLKFVRVP